MAHDIFSEPTYLVLWLIFVVILLGIIIVAGIDTSKLLTEVYLKVFNYRTASLINLASAMPEGSELYIPVKPKYSIGKTTVIIHQSFSKRYVEVKTELKLKGHKVFTIDTTVPITGVFATGIDPVLKNKYIAVNYLYQTKYGYGFISPWSGAFISMQTATASSILSFDREEQTTIIVNNQPVTITEVYWVYNVDDKAYLHVIKHDGLIVIEKK